MRRLLIGTALLVFVALATLSVQTADAQGTTGPKLLTYFPRDGTPILTRSSIIFVFSELMDGPSVNTSLTVSTELGAKVSMDLSGECGDATTLTFSPDTGRWSPGNYTMEFTTNVRSAHGVSFAITVPIIHFVVKDNVALAAKAAVVDVTGGVTQVSSGVAVTVTPGNVKVELTFSVSIDLAKLVTGLSEKAVSKTSDCGGVSVSLALSISAGSTIQFELNGTNVVDRNNATNRLGSKLVIVLVGTGGQGGQPGFDLGPLAPLFLALDVFEPVIVAGVAFYLWRRHRAQQHPQPGFSIQEDPPLI